MREPIRLLLRPAPLLALLLCTAGCPHRTPPAADSAGDADLRRKNLFVAFDADARDLSLVNAYLLELACYVGDKGDKGRPSRHDVARRHPVVVERADVRRGNNSVAPSARSAAAGSGTAFRLKLMSPSAFLLPPAPPT